MNEQELMLLFNRIYPNFFEGESIRNLPEEWVCDEMSLKLCDFDIKSYSREMEHNISFGLYEGDLTILKKQIARVVESWPDFYTKDSRIYCGFIDGKVASFCLIEDMGKHKINHFEYKIGGPGCVGTLPEYRHNGIGLTMVLNVTQILKEEGYDYSYIHFTGVAPWYERLGYKTFLHWNRNGIMKEDKE